MKDYLPIARNRRRGRGRKYRRNQAGLGAVKQGFAMLQDVETWKSAGWIATGSVVSPLLAAVFSGAINKARPGTVPEKGIMATLINLGGAIGTYALASVTMRDSKVARLVLTGALAAIAGDFTQENILPAIGLGDYVALDQMGMGDYATLPPGYDGMADYMTVPPGVGDYASLEQASSAATGRSYAEEF